MNIVFGAGHPKQVHFMKNAASILENNGHKVKFLLITNKENSDKLLNKFNFQYDVIYSNNKFGRMNIINTIYKAYRISKSFNSDILFGGGFYFAYVSKMIGNKHIMAVDTENQKFNLIGYPITDVILTPACFKNIVTPSKHIPFDGYFELAYLHPKYFTPEPNVLANLGLNKRDKFVILRLINWEASHDFGHKGIINPEELIKKIENYCNIFISAECILNKRLRKYRLNIKPEQLHDLLYYSTLYIGEGTAMACESAILGTPSIYINSQKRGYLEELEKRYDLLYNFNNPRFEYHKAIEKAIELLENKRTKTIWRKRRKRMLREKIDVTALIVRLIESVEELSKNGKIDVNALRKLSYENTT